MEIVKWDEDKMRQLPAIFHILSGSLGSNNGIAYAVLDEGKLNVFAHNKERAVYIYDKDGKVTVTPYMLDENYNIKSFSIGSKQYAYFGERVSVFDLEKGVEESLLLADYSDDNDPDGLLCYTQYNHVKDIECEIQYEHRYMKSRNEERARIYTYTLSDMCSLMIDKKRSYELGVGLIPKGYEYYSLLDLTSDTYDYGLVALKEAGLAEVVKQGARSILGSDRITRYVKGVYVGRDGVFKTLWPLSKPYKKEEILKIIEKYGFSTEIPEELVDLYNDQNEFVNKSREILQKVKEIDKLRDTERCIIYGLHP